MGFKEDNSKFFLDLDEFEERIEIDLVKLQREAVLLFLTQATSHGRSEAFTPVGNPDLWKNPAPVNYRSGTAISNWRVGINKIDGTIVDIQDSSGATSRKQVDKLGNLQPFSIVWISNNLPYINRIMEQGWSTQTPQGSTELILQSVIKNIKFKYG